MLVVNSRDCCKVHRLIVTYQYIHTAIRRLVEHDINAIKQVSLVTVAFGFCIALQQNSMFYTHTQHDVTDMQSPGPSYRMGPVGRALRPREPEVQSD